MKYFFILSVFSLLPNLTLAANKAPVSDAGDVAGLQQRVQQLERKLNSQGLLDLLQQVEALQTEIGRLRGQIEVQSHELEQLKEQQRKMFTDVDRRLQRMQAAGGSRTLEAIETDRGDAMAEPAGDAGLELTVEDETAESPSDGDADVAAKTGDAGMETEPGTDTETTEDTGSADAADPLRAQADYQQAFNLLKQANYNQAIEAFSDYLQKYPTGKYSDNAQYWLGETYYVKRDFDNAINAYQALIDNYPESSKLAHGMLKIGFSYHELGNLQEARERLETVSNRFPGTTAARLAEDRLRTIKIPGSG
mgnify:CR=1 FL=1